MKTSDKWRMAQGNPIIEIMQELKQIERLMAQDSPPVSPEMYEELSRREDELKVKLRRLNFLADVRRKLRSTYPVEDYPTFDMLQRRKAETDKYVFVQNEPRPVASGSVNVALLKEALKEEHDEPTDSDFEIVEKNPEVPASSSVNIDLLRDAMRED